MIAEDKESAVEEVRAVAPTRRPIDRLGPSGREPVLCDL